MNVLLLSPVAKLGKAGEVKAVADGYARNFLFPRKLAEPATDAAIARVHQAKQEQAILEKNREVRARELVKQLSGLSVEIVAKAKGEKLFGSVHEREIVRAIESLGVSGVSEQWIVMQEPIKTIGVFEIDAKNEFSKARFTVSVRSEKKE